MRYVSSIPPVSTSSRTRQVSELTAVHAIKPVHAPIQPDTSIKLDSTYQVAIPVVEHREYIPAVDRRKICRRVKHQTVLVELRSGIDRRHHNLRNGDVAEHIDEIA